MVTAGHIGAFAIHGSGLALGNVLLPSCWMTYRALRKSNILHTSQTTYNLGTVSYPKLYINLMTY